MKASAAGRRFQSTSWNGLVSLVVASAGRGSTTPAERVKAAEALADGQDVTIAGVRIHPEGDS